MSVYISNIEKIRPKYELEQQKIADWLAEAHAKSAEKTIPLEEQKAFKQRIAFFLKKLGSRIEKRGVETLDIFHQDWDGMEIFALNKDPSGEACHVRTDFYHDRALSVFERFYPKERPFPDHLIHVSCTGYVSPSAAQLLVANRDKGQQCRVTHAYHMGCYGAFSALKMAQGYLAHNPAQRVDIVHTEMGSLHLNPSLHTPDQLIIQSLFSDGHINYELTSEKNGPAIELIKLQEEILPNSASLMDWRLGTHGMRFILLKEVPVAIGTAIKAFIERLLQGRPLSGLYFAIHPGGVKIIEQIAEILNLEAWQYAHSLEIMRAYGNMSSGTIPHVWERLLHDSDVPDGAEIVSLAFGPGITISGGLLKKCSS